jgi:5'-nucleotidase
MTVMNINVPWKDEAKVKGVKVTKIGFRNYSEDIDQRVDFRGRSYYWIGGVYEGFQELMDSDCQAIEDDLISVSPMKLMDYGIPLDDLIGCTKKFLEKISLQFK